MLNTVYTQNRCDSHAACVQDFCLSTFAGILQSKLAVSQNKFVIQGFADMLRLKDLLLDSLILTIYIKNHSVKKCWTSLC